jgi:hypothetical protein
MILIVNEGEEAVREQLYVLDAGKLFGGANALKRPETVDRWDFAGIPEDSDWSKSKLRGERIMMYGYNESRRPSGDVPFLLDLEDDGGVAQSVSLEGDREVYLRVYVPARGFRLLFGRAAGESG